MQQLLSYDRDLFRLINSHWNNTFFDWLMPWLRNANVWFPLYIFLLVLVLVNFKKTGWIWLLFATGTVICTDFVSSKLIKETIWRTRPCNDPDLATWIRVLVGYRPQNSSFTSSHAANHFGMAMFFYTTLSQKFRHWPRFFFLWAFAISYAQVYVGVHYPLDIFCGTLVGVGIGYLTGRSFNKKYALN